MISTRPKQLLFASVILFYVHGLEEILTGFYKIDPLINAIANSFSNMPQAVYWVLHIEWWLGLAIASALLLGGKWVQRIMIVYGLVLLFETHHLWSALVTRGYFPGSVTALLLTTIAIFYWRELIILIKNPTPGV